VVWCGEIGWCAKTRSRHLAHALQLVVGNKKSRCKVGNKKSWCKVGKEGLPSWLLTSCVLLPSGARKRVLRSGLLPCGLHHTTPHHTTPHHTTPHHNTPDHTTTNERRRATCWRLAPTLLDERERETKCGCTQTRGKREREED